MLATSPPGERALVVAVLRRRGLCGGRLGDGRARRCVRLLCRRRIGHRDRRCMGAGAVDQPGAGPADVAPVPRPPAGGAPGRCTGRGRCRVVEGGRRRRRPDGMGPDFGCAVGNGGGDGGPRGALLAVRAAYGGRSTCWCSRPACSVCDRVPRVVLDGAIGSVPLAMVLVAAAAFVVWPLAPIGRRPCATCQKSSTSPIESDQRSSVGSSVPPTSRTVRIGPLRGVGSHPRARVAGRCAGGSRPGWRMRSVASRPCST